MKTLHSGGRPPVVDHRRRIAGPDPAVATFLDTGYFALETHALEIATAIREFLVPIVSQLGAQPSREGRGGQ